MGDKQKTAADLRREQADVMNQMRGILTAVENGEATEAQTEAFEHLNQRQAKLNDTIRMFTAQEALEAAMSESQGTIAGPQGGETATRTLGGSVDRATLMGFTPAGVTVFDRAERDRLIEMRLQEAYGEGIFSAEKIAATGTDEYRAAFRSYLRRGSAGVSAAELRTLQEGVDPSGGYLVPEDMLSRIISREPAPTRVNGRVTAIPTMRDRISAPRVVYTADNIYTTGVRATWTGELPASGTAHRVTDPVFGQLAIDVHTAMMSLPMSLDFLEDAAFPVVSWVTSKFGETIDLLRDDVAINGNGVGRPHGILENPGATDEPAITASGSAAAVIPDGLQDIVWDVPEQYEENSTWLFNKNSTGKTIAKLKDTSNRYLWQPYEQSGLVGGRRADLLGYPVVMSAFMPNVSAGTYPIVFGDLRGYYRVDRVGLSVQVLRERYAEENQVLLLGRIRLGGDVAEGYRLRIQRVSAS
jgi:HK97 family phage major capsid protein